MGKEHDFCSASGMDPCSGLLDTYSLLLVYMYW
jgi:hypothetical protein